MLRMSLGIVPNEQAATFPVQVVQSKSAVKRRMVISLLSGGSLEESSWTVVKLLALAVILRPSELFF